MKIIKTSDKLPSLKKRYNQKINKKELLELAEQVGKILKKEGRIGLEENANISSSRNVFSY
ncbi:hypothetical protein ISS86_03350 [Candidatus Microgenomates bacterium]|nr:hypothetical protein [Candidatus Microgenomates bacterium]